MDEEKELTPAEKREKLKEEFKKELKMKMQFKEQLKTQNMVNKAEEALQKAMSMLENSDIDLEMMVEKMNMDAELSEAKLEMAMDETSSKTLGDIEKKPEESKTEEISTENNSENKTLGDDKK